MEDAQVFQTDNISSEIHLNLAGNSYVHKLACSDLHIRQDEEEGRLQIYIPRKARRRESCYRIKLPPRLREWLMTDPDTNQVSELMNGECHHLINSILNSSRNICSQILGEHGISSIDLVEPDSDDQNSDSGDTPAEEVEGLSTPPEDEVERPGTASSGSFVPVLTPATSTPEKSQTRYHAFSPESTVHIDPMVSVITSSSSSGGRLDSMYFPSPPGMRTESTAIPIHGTALWDEKQARVSQIQPSYGTVMQIGASSSDASRYQRLLERVVDAARDVDLNNLCSMSILLEMEASFGFSYLPKIERNWMIGAAGELCVGPPYALSNGMCVNVLTHGRFSKGSRHLVRHYLISRWRIGRAQSDTTSALTQIIKTFSDGMGLKGPILCTMISRAPSHNSSSTKVS